MKGQISYIIKPLALIIVIAITIYMLYSSLASFAFQKSKAASVDTWSAATNILLLLANSPDCIAFKFKAGYGYYSNVVDVKKLEEFAKVYKDIEPRCARNYMLGWRVEVVELNEKGETKNKWEFGASSFSYGKALRESLEVWMPIAIYYESKKIVPGKMKIKIVKGELEEVAGLVDLACYLGRKEGISKEVRLSLPIWFDERKNRICIGKKSKEACRRLECKVLSFKDIKKPGTYVIRASYLNGRVIVNA